MFQWFKTKSVTPEASATPYAPPAYEAPREPSTPPTWEVINRQLTEIINQQHVHITRLEEELSLVKPLLQRRNAQFDNLVDLAGKAMETANDAKTYANTSAGTARDCHIQMRDFKAEISVWAKRLDAMEATVKKHDREIGDLIFAVNRILKTKKPPTKKKK
jgi:ABC-type transporter Mla subunit MlaD